MEFVRCPIPTCWLLLIWWKPNNSPGEWLWANVTTPTLANANQAAAFSHFLDFVKVGSVLHPGAAMGAPDLAPQIEFDYAVVQMSNRVRDQYMARLATHAAGLGNTLGVAAQLQAMGQQTAAIQALAVAQAQPAPAPTIQSKNVALVWAIAAHL